MFHLYSTRYFEFDRNTSSLFYQKFTEFEHEEEIKECKKNEEEKKKLKLILL